MKSALVHYWLVNRRGGEHVLDALGEILPDADLISHVIDEKLLVGPLAGRQTRQTFIHKLPFARRRYAAYLPLMPIALEVLDMSEYGLIISSESGPAKWVIKDPDAHHICYVHTPLRYIWDQRKVYQKKIPRILHPIAELYSSHLRKSDQHSSLGVDQFVANSSFVARRIESYYRRDSVVIHPPVHTEQFSIRPDVDDYYVFAGELRGYKCADVAIEACNRLKRRLKIIGSGASTDLVRSAGPLVEFLGRLPDDAYRTTLARARALLFPGVEDFGIIPVEAMASGRPVIARGKGGAMDTVVHGETGILYDEPTVEGLMAAILTYEAEERNFRPELCRQQSQRFDHATFIEKFSKLLPG